MKVIVGSSENDFRYGIRVTTHKETENKHSLSRGNQNEEKIFGNISILEIQKPVIELHSITGHLHRLQALGHYPLASSSP